MLTVLSLNTAVDRIMVVPDFRSAAVNRADRSQGWPGGKGLNVARVIRELGRTVRVIGFLGGSVAPFIRQGCDDLGIEQCWVPIAGESRTCIIVVDPDGAGQTVINEDGPIVTPAEVEAMRRQIEANVAAGDLLAISGSAPPGVPETFYAEIVRTVQHARARVLADVSGPALRRIAAVHPWALAPNLDEFHQAFDSSVEAPAAALQLAALTDHALLTAGAEGVWYAHDGAVRHLIPPAVKPVNAVGSGDALVAGFLVGIDEGLEPLEALRLGVACGAANAARLEPGIGTRQEVELLHRGIRVELHQVLMDS